MECLSELSFEMKYNFVIKSVMISIDIFYEEFSFGLVS